MNKPKFIVVHCSDIKESALYDQFTVINNYHRDGRGFPVSSLASFVGYHSLITGGKNYKCRLDSDVGAHCRELENGIGMNFQSLGVCVGFDGDVEYPNKTHIELLRQQIKDWQKKHNIPDENIRFHREFSLEGKTCPGSLITKEWLDNVLKDPLEEPISPLDESNSEKEHSTTPPPHTSVLGRFIAFLKKCITTYLGEYMK